MFKAPIDASQLAQGTLSINTKFLTRKIPNPILILLIEQIQRVVAESGYANVTVEIM